MATTAVTDLPVHRLDVQTYNRMVLSGALDGQRVELLEGLIVEMSPLSPAHNAVVTMLMRHFAKAPRWWLQVQATLEVPPNAEPEPDLLVAAHKPPPGQHLRSALLAVEVAVNSHTIDRDLKATLYARAGIPTYWLVDVPGRAVEVRTQPGGEGYGRCEIYGEGAYVPSPLDGVGDVEIAAVFADLDDQAV